MRRLALRYFSAGAFVLLLLATYEVVIHYKSANWLLKQGFISKEDYIRQMKTTFVQRVNLSQTSSTFDISADVGIKVTIKAEDFRKNSNLRTGNILIDNYGKNDPMKNGEKGRGVTFVGEEKRNVSTVMQKFQVNVIASDIIPLNRLVPDSRPPG